MKQVAEIAPARPKAVASAAPAPTARIPAAATTCSEYLAKRAAARLSSFTTRMIARPAQQRSTAGRLARCRNARAATAWTWLVSRESNTLGRARHPARRCGWRLLGSAKDFRSFHPRMGRRPRCAAGHPGRSLPTRRGISARRSVRRLTGTRRRDHEHDAGAPATARWGARSAGCPAARPHIRPSADHVTSGVSGSRLGIERSTTTRRGRVLNAMRRRPP